MISETFMVLLNVLKEEEIHTQSSMTGTTQTEMVMVMEYLTQVISVLITQTIDALKKQYNTASSSRSCFLWMDNRQ